MMRKLNLVAGLALAALAVAYATFPAVGVGATQSAEATVFVPVTVVDSKNVPVTTLAQEHFQLMEEGKDQKVTFFSKPGDPMTEGVVLELSSSGPVKAAGARDRSSIEILSAVDKVREAGAGQVAFEQIPLDSDGIYGVISKNIAAMTQQGNHRKALIVVGDGMVPNGSSQEAMQMPKALMETARRAQFPIYFLFTVTSLPEPALTEASSYVVGYNMQQMAIATGGDVVVGQVDSNLLNSATTLRDKLKGQYVLGFTSTNPAKDGKYRKLTVKVNPPAPLAKLKVTAKSQYFVPKDAGD